MKLIQTRVVLTVALVSGCLSGTAAVQIDDDLVNTWELADVLMGRLDYNQQPGPHPTVQISNATLSYTASSSPRGFFSAQVSDNLGLTDGLIFSSGHAYFAQYPNEDCFEFSEQASHDWLTMPGDSDLDDLVWQAGTYEKFTEDAIVYEFDFVPPAYVGRQPVTSVQFNFVFATEEYPTYDVEAGDELLFDDVFAFYIDGQNKALIPGTSDPIKVSTVVEDEDFWNNCDGSINSVYNGYTPVYSFSHTVQASQTYHVKIAIADTRDGALDSAVFIGRAIYQ